MWYFALVQAWCNEGFGELRWIFYISMKGCHRKLTIIFELFVFFHSLVWGETDPSDAAVLDNFRKGLENPELLRWGNDDNPCGPPAWPHLVCSGDRVTHIQVKNLGLIGPLPQNFNKLSKLQNLGLQRNNFTGKLPSFSGLAELQFAYLGNNQFDTIPYDFFSGLDNLQVLSLDYNPLNKTGWSVPLELRNSAQLMNLSMMSTNIIGPLPEFLSELSSLTALKLSFNRFTGEIPRSYQGSQFQILWLNGNELTGPIDIVASMLSLKLLWLNFNQFTGKIPAGLAHCTSLTDLWLDHNHLVGPIPEKLTSLPLNSLRLDANKLMGPIPKFSKGVASYADNSFCQSRPGIPCSPEVSTLLDFLSDVNYPLNLASSWLGNDPCISSWLGITCSNQRVSVINLPNLKLNGTLSPALGQLDSLARIMLEGNNLTGVIPENYTKLNSLRLLDLTDNNLEPPIPAFNNTVKLVIAGNQFLTGREPEAAPFPSTPTLNPPSSPYSPLVPNINPNTSNSSIQYSLKAKNSKLQKLWVIIIPSVVLLCLSLLIFVWCKKKRRGSWAPPFVVHPRDPSGSEVKIVIANEANGNSSTNESTSQSKEGSGGVDTHVFESGNLVISVQVLRSVTKNFASHNELGRGGFGTVYKGKFQDGSVIAVKRMESCVISNKAIDEFQSEIAVLSKVRHRHLVSLLGYSIEGNERLLVYEYMPLGALSTHLFQWKMLNLEPLSWKRRLNIALDVARGMEYLHNLAQQSFIHRDLKSSNILLGDDFRAKVSDFGLVKLAPDGKHSIATRLAGTFGYLAPEYAVTGKITTKADVFSYGVVLMELVTGLTALDEDRPEESRYLAEWFWRIKSNKERLRAAIDPSLDVNEETIESIFIVAEMAGHCTARDPNQRPDMSHAVTVLAPLVEKWRPVYNDQEEYMGIDCSQPLGQMVKLWQATDISGYFSNDDSRGSIPPVPSGFADSFAPIDAR